VSEVISAFLVWTVLVPFVPVLVPASDTQPVFLLVFVTALLAAFAFPAAGKKLFRISMRVVITITLLAMVLYACLIVANASQQDPTIPSRLVSFLQFAAAVFWGYAGKFEWSEKVLFRALTFYALFTVIYFASGGIIENTLIHSRAENAQSLFAMGRGARTLSPEPSFFALQVFNIFILARIVSSQRVGEAGVDTFKWVLVTGFCLAASFSAYGALLLVAVVLAVYPRLFLILSVITVAGWGLVSRFLSDWESVRAVKVVLTIVESRGRLAELMLLDISFASRIGSFSDYIRSFGKHPFSGNGFSLYEGGGFISIVAAFGIVGLAFFTWVVQRIIRGGFDARTKIVLLLWFVLNFVSGPIGVPIIGVIIGQIMAARRVAPRSRDAAVNSSVPELALAR
jgi:hypothetical protein